MEKKRKSILGGGEFEELRKRAARSFIEAGPSRKAKREVAKAFGTSNNTLASWADRYFPGERVKTVEKGPSKLDLLSNQVNALSTQLARIEAQLDSVAKWIKS